MLEIKPWASCNFLETGFSVTQAGLQLPSNPPASVSQVARATDTPPQPAEVFFCFCFFLMEGNRLVENG
jgi:hypothetical protein